MEDGDDGDFNFDDMPRKFTSLMMSNNRGLPFVAEEEGG